MLAPRRGREVLDAWEFWRPGGALADRARWLGILQARSIAGGAIPADDYVLLKAEILAGLVAAVADAPLDGVVLDIHGAASVVGLDDMEGDLAVAVREAVGPDCLISSGMDLHGNVSRTLAETVDLLTTYRTAPHVDWQETKERAARNLLARLALPPGRRRPAKAWVPVPILLPGEMTSTRQEPATSLYARVPEIEALDGILDAGIWIGYPWADEPRNGAVVVVVGDDADLAMTEATALATELWERREELRLRRADRVARRGARSSPRLAGHALLRVRLRRQPDRRRRRRRDLDTGRAAGERGAGGERQARDLRLDPRRHGRARGRGGRSRRRRTPHDRRAGRRPSGPTGGGRRRGGGGRAVRRQPGGRRAHPDGRRRRHPSAPALPPRAGLHPARPRPAQRRHRRGQDRLPRARALRHGRRLDAGAHPGWRRPGPGAARSPAGPAPDVPPRRRQRGRSARGRRAVPR